MSVCAREWHLCVLLIRLLALIRLMRKVLWIPLYVASTVKLMPGAFCIEVLGVHLLLVYLQGCADLFGAEKEGWELNGNRNSEVLLPGFVLTKPTNRRA